MSRTKKFVSALLSTVMIAGALFTTPTVASAATADATVSAAQTSGELKSGLINLRQTNVVMRFSRTCGRLITTPSRTKVFVDVEEVKSDGVKLIKNKDYVVKYYDTGLDYGSFGVYICGIGKYFGVVQKYYNKTSMPKFLNANWKVERNSDTLKISEQVTDNGKTLERGTDFNFSSQVSIQNRAVFTYTGEGEYKGYKIIGEWSNPRTIRKANTTVTLSSIDGYWDLSMNGVRRSERVVYKNDDGTTKILQKDVDYVIDYYDKPGTNQYRVSITGIGGYDGSVHSAYCTYDSSADVKFVWGRDNWGFKNDAGYNDFCECLKNYDERNTKGNFFVFKAQTKNAPKRFRESEYQSAVEGIRKAVNYNAAKAKNGINLKGICEGMSVSLIFSKLGIFTDPIHVQGDARDTAIITKNSFMHGFLWANVSYSFDLKEKNVSCTQGIKIASLEKELKNDSYVKLTYQLFKEAKGKQYETGHAVVAYGSEDCYYYSNVTNRSYDRRILICDPNGGDRDCLTNTECLYYNSADYSWIIPYQNGSSAKNVCYCNSSDDESHPGARNGSIQKVVKYSVHKNKYISYTNVENIPETYINDVKAKNNNELFVKGDVNRDGAVDERDVSFLRQIIAEENGLDVNHLNATQKTKADLYPDGIIDRHDMYQLQHLVNAN